ncbi:unnamed protein product [Arabis nemorensis]|uniref:Uncharacterized protein n=1 Tax=Arabis nemorensis TaxID=586526 RepID=A0A565AU89_9BRAS|nr:unnamed protein product [Arabis nemorensis]
MDSSGSTAYQTLWLGSPSPGLAEAWACHAIRLVGLCGLAHRGSGLPRHGSWDSTTRRGLGGSAHQCLGLDET